MYELGLFRRSVTRGREHFTPVEELVFSILRDVLRFLRVETDLGDIRDLFFSNN